jgi:uncharacterized repeat protein (TIGR03833 family)
MVKLVKEVAVLVTEAERVKNITSSSSNVLSSHQVVPGAHVSIILKIDQPTGRQVQGTVAEVLTSGDHHRGVKVRLVDGRVGSVQRIVTEEPGREFEQEWRKP